VHERERNARVFRAADKFSTSKQPAREIYRGLFCAHSTEELAEKWRQKN
jgi:hypothetical protein